MNGYQLTRRWYNYKFGNPDKVRHIHSDMYFYIVDLWNRLGQKEKIGLPTSVTMEALGIGSYNTYKKALAELIEFGFIVEISEAKNQHQSRIIALSINDKATNRALDSALSINDEATDEAPDKAVAEPTDETPDGIVEEKEPKTIEGGNTPHPLRLFISDNFPLVGKLQTQLTDEDCETLTKKFPRALIVDKLESMENRSDLGKHTSVNITLSKWCTQDAHKYKITAPPKEYVSLPDLDYKAEYDNFVKAANEKGMKLPFLKTIK